MKEKQSEVCTHEGHEYVDLGLPSGTMWATCNVGADKPEECGDYFAWGEVQTKKDFTNENYESSFGSFNDSVWDLGPNFDLYNIESSDADVATALWGGSWHLPTFNQFSELLNECDIKWCEVNGMWGKKFISKNNGNSVFFPTPGTRYDGCVDAPGNVGDYWSCELKVDHDLSFLFEDYDESDDEEEKKEIEEELRENRVYRAMEMTFDKDGEGITGCHRAYGLSVRPVFD